MEPLVLLDVGPSLVLAWKVRAQMAPRAVFATDDRILNGIGVLGRAGVLRTKVNLLDPPPLLTSPKADASENGPGHIDLDHAVLECRVCQIHIGLFSAEDMQGPLALVVHNGNLFGQVCHPSLTLEVNLLGYHLKCSGLTPLGSSASPCALTLLGDYVVWGNPQERYD